MLFIYRRENGRLPLKLISVETGETLLTFTHDLKKGKIQIIEQFNEKVLIKQKNQNLLIQDVS